MLSLLLTLSLASAQEAPPIESGPPLAIPAGATLPPVQLVPPARPPVTPSQVQAINAYRTQRLDIRSENELHGGGATVVSSTWGPPRLRWYPGYSYVIQDPIYSVPSWGIYQGPERLSVPEYLGAVGKVGQKADLEAEIEQLERRSHRWYTVGGLGVAATVGGVVTQIISHDPYTNYYARWTALGGAGAMVVGFVAGSFPSAKAEVKESRPADWLDAGQIQQEIDSHNSQLAAELGLTPEQQLMIDNSTPTIRWSPQVRPLPRGGVSIGVGANF